MGGGGGGGGGLPNDFHHFHPHLPPSEWEGGEGEGEV